MSDLIFYSMATGSSGNSYYLGDSECGFLVDVGIPFRTIRKRMEQIGVPMTRIKAVLVTHDHFDHVRSVGYFSEKQHIPIYATEASHIGINTNYGITEKVSPWNQKMLTRGEPLVIGNFSITPFTIPHDSKDNNGFFIKHGDVRFTLATDIGCVTDDLRNYISISDYLVIEADFDEEKLLNGPYHPKLKVRIMGEGGHLSNRQAAEVVAQHASPFLKKVFLCHLSKTNNEEALAQTTVQSALKTDTEVIVLKRNEGMLFNL
ncbi:MAG: MBL fold metallo-hydrolase [Paludibacteraceae bacterium]|jgi:Metal-dependent hydrolases of the beta-lactamase superfamily I|nr:MBL fold metallo-hydrolase [Paludibacteraceae bacterium]